MTDTCAAIIFFAIRGHIFLLQVGLQEVSSGRSAGSKLHGHVASKQ